jgi:hypothetical protein
MEAVDVLNAAFPSTLKQYDDNGIQRIVFENSLYFDVVSLAREADIHRILPAAYYRYCEIFSFDEVLEGITRPDGTLSTLSVQDQQVIMRGWHRLLGMQPLYTFRWITLELQANAAWFTGCEARTPRNCTFARQQLLCNFYLMGSKCRALRSWDPAWELHMCDSCTKFCKAAHAHGRASVWWKLPLAFGLPDWNTMLEE